MPPKIHKGGTSHIRQDLATWTLEEQFARDQALWVGTFRSPGNDVVLNFITKMFITYLYGGLMIRQGAQWMWCPGDFKLAVIPSHNGRVMIQLPKADPDYLERNGGTYDHRFWEWLTLGGVPRRKAATHSIQRNQAPYMPLIGGRRKYLTELKTMSQGGAGDHYGLNIPLGGEGNLNPFSGNVISANGEHGHMYVYYMPPSATEYGGLLIGGEASADLKFDQTGKWHDFWGSAGEFMASGGVSFNKMGAGPRNFSGSYYDTMIVDLVGTGWTFLRDKEFREGDLVRVPEPGRPVLDLHAVEHSEMWTPAEWVRRSKVTFGARSGLVKAIDALVEGYAAALNSNQSDKQKHGILMNIVAACDEYQRSSQNSKRLPAVRELRQRAINEMQRLKRIGGVTVSGMNLGSVRTRARR